MCIIIQSRKRANRKKLTMVHTRRAVTVVLLAWVHVRHGLAFQQMAQFPTANKAIPKTHTSDLSSLLGRNYETSLSMKDSSAEELLGKARKLREEIETSQASRVSSPSKVSFETKAPISPWSLEETNVTAYRFYVDIGREEGTWMEPRFGASGQRIEFTLDVGFTTRLVDRKVSDQMVRDNRGASSSPAYCLTTAPFARLRGGFDRMKCQPGAYRIDTSCKGQKTLRLFFRAEGKKYGDVYIPEDSNIYMSLPILPDSSLSRKEGIVSVRQYGWKTGWYRLESRILGVVKASPMADARIKDGF